MQQFPGVFVDGKVDKSAILRDAMEETLQKCLVRMNVSRIGRLAQNQSAAESNVNEEPKPLESPVQIKQLHVCL